MAISPKTDMKDFIMKEPIPDSTEWKKYEGLNIKKLKSLFHKLKRSPPDKKKRINRV